MDSRDGQLSSLSEGEHIAVAIAHEQLAHTIDSVDRPLDDIGFPGTQLCCELVDVGNVDVGVKRLIHQASVGTSGRYPRWPRLAEHDADVIALDDREARWVTEELVEREAQNIAIELCGREDIIHEKIWGHAVHRAPVRAFILVHGQSSCGYDT